MSTGFPSDPERASSPDIPEAAAARLFARASELDAARANRFTIEELRMAAAGAGISTDAFDAALAEQGTAGRADLDRATGGGRRPGVWGLFAGAGLVLVATLSLLLTGASDPAPTAQVSCDSERQVLETMIEMTRNPAVFDGSPAAREYLQEILLEREEGLSPCESADVESGRRLL